jgi:hypothetical protein
MLSLVAFLLVAGLGSGVQHPLASSLVSRAYETGPRRAALGTYNFAGDLGKIAVPAAVEGGTHYELDVAGETVPDGFEGLENRGKDSFVLVEVGRETDAGTLRLHPGPRDDPGAFTLVLRVVDEHGGPVVGATAVLSRSVRSPRMDSRSPARPPWRSSSRGRGGQVVCGLVAERRDRAHSDPDRAATACIVAVALGPPPWRSRCSCRSALR